MNNNLSVIGQTATSATGSVAVQAAAVTGVSAVASTLNLGDETLITNNNLSVTGFVGTSTLNSVTAQANADIDVTGNQVTTGLTGVNVWGLIDDSQTPNYSTINTTQNPNWKEVA